MENQATFEASLKKLEEIVQKMEQGELGLDESITLFRDGILCSKQCTEALKAAELKIQELKADMNGELRLEMVSEDQL